MKQLFHDKRCIHVLYSYNGLKNYVEQAVSYIHDGIVAGDYVIFIENDRFFPIIQKELEEVLSKEQMERVKWINNFDFYYSSGSYHPPAIKNYFNQVVEPYIVHKTPFRSWAHVEWTTMQDPFHLIEDFEKIVDEAVHQLSFPLICAYEGKQMPAYLEQILMDTHPYVLMEDVDRTS
jgi:MEDS: MEthanogen/methylotroph, DcmR Sensory domain